MGRFLLVFIFRILLLVVGGGLAMLAGVAIATKYPNPTAGKPLVANLLPSIDKQSATPAPTASPVSTTETPTPAEPATQLTEAERKKLEAELKRVQARLKRLQNRPRNRETIEKLEQRVQTIEAQLQGSQQSSSDQQANQLAASSTPFFSPDTRMVSLPSDALFEDNQNILRPQAEPILNKIADELKNYPQATIHIGVHTDGAGQPKNNRVLSFRQAQVIEQYLSSALDKGYHWIVVGYGETRPVAPNDTPINLQRNRRIEIAIE